MVVVGHGVNLLVFSCFARLVIPLVVVMGLSWKNIIQVPKV